MSIITQFFTPEIMKEISQLVDSLELTDNNLRADALKDFLEQFNFHEIGCGTNRAVYTHDDTDDFVFKIALDRRGLTDNDMEYKLSTSLAPYVAQCYENNSIISVAERADRITKEMVDDYYDEMMEILQKLSQNNVLYDVGPKSYKNWGIRENYGLIIIDYAYMVNIKGIDFTCKKYDCGGRLAYTDDLSMLECMECGARYDIGTIIGNIADKFTEMGFEAPSDDNVSGTTVESRTIAQQMGF